MCRQLISSKSVLHQLLVTVVLLLQCVRNGAAIKCFVCDSSDNPSCADLKSNSSIVPEECTLDKMKSIDTWLFELNRFAYFDTGASKSPLMNCQKVVARDPRTMKMVTARFCQLDTADSDACNILRVKMGLPPENAAPRNNNNNNNAKRGKYAQHANDNADEEEEEQYHCSICKTDCCNASWSLHSGNRTSMALTTSAALVLITLAIRLRRSVW